MDEDEVQRLKDQLARERRLDAKRKRIRMLNDVLRELDLAVYMQLITIYHCDCSFFWFAVRAVIHGTLLTPTADPVGERPPDEPKPFLPLVLCAFLANFLLHQLYPAPTAGNLYWQKDRMKRKDYEKMKAEKDRKDQRERWLKELEMRDEEDKAWKERLAKKPRGATEEARGVSVLVAEKTKELKDKTLGK